MEMILIIITLLLCFSVGCLFFLFDTFGKLKAAKELYRELHNKNCLLNNSLDEKTKSLSFSMQKNERIENVIMELEGKVTKQDRLLVLSMEEVQYKAEEIESLDGEISLLKETAVEKGREVDWWKKENAALYVLLEDIGRDIEKKFILVRLSRKLAKEDSLF